jgi:hypothetical protein
MRCGKLSHLLLVLWAVGCDQPETTPIIREARPAAATLPQTPDEAYADYLAVSPPPMVAEKDADGRPLLYYGRIFARSDVELRALDVLWFTHDQRPFFDEYDATPGQADGDYSRGNWEYAVGTGAQWNVLIGYPGIVSAVQINPKLAAIAPHPMMDNVTEPSGALNLPMVAQLGLELPTPPTLPRTCGGSFLAIGAAGLIDDILVAIYNALSEAANWVVNIVKALGGAIDEVLQRAYDAVSDAIDRLRELGNGGVCALAGARSHNGIVYLHDPHINAAFAAPFGPRAAHPEPFRRVNLRARGGPGGILLTTTRTGIDGRYAFDDLCGGLDYTLAMELTTPWAWLTHNGFSVAQLDLGTVHPGDDSITWTVHDSPEADWLMGLQLGWQTSVDRFRFVPKQAKVVTGLFSDKIVGTISSGASVTTCGQLELVAVLLPVAEVVGNLLNGDIYMNSRGYHPDGNDIRSGPGVAAHEYGHHAMCEAIRQLGGDLDRFLNHYVLTLLNVLGGGDPLKDPLRNTLESIADFTAFLTMGYTDYFQSDFNGLNVCGSWAKPSLSCLEDDGVFPLSTDGHTMVASRASIMFDWIARAVDPEAPMFASSSDHLGLPADVIPRAAARVGSQIVTDNLASFVALSDDDGRPADGLCRVYRDHGWSCDDLSHLPVTLEAPGGFDGVATVPGAITWSWLPTSPLATQYVLVNAAGAAWSDVQAVGPDVARTTEAIVGGPGNQRVVAAVESRRPGATAARSARIARCTMATPASAVSVAADYAGIALAWNAGDATNFAISRAEGPGSFALLAVVDGTSFLDGSAGPGVQYRYRVTARNCDGVESAPAEVMAGSGVDESLLLFADATVAAGGDGSRARPFSSIADAIGAVTATRRTLVVAGGVYRERLRVNQDGVAIFGGYSHDFTARDPGARPTSIIGDGTSWTVFRSALGNAMAPLVESRGDRLILDGVDFSPGSLLCFGGCLRMSLAYATGELDLVRVHYQGAEGIDLPTANDYTAVDCATCRVVDSTLAEPPSAAGKPISAMQATEAHVAGSLLVGGVFAGNLDIDRSVLRADGGNWSSSGAGARSHCAQVINSIVAGAIALQLTATTCRSALIASAFYGPVSVSNTWVVDDIFVADGAIPLDFADPGGSAVGMVVRNNLFVPLAGQGVATTVSRTARVLGPLPPESVNDATAWFASTANDVAQNQTAGSLAALFRDPAPFPPGHALHSLPGAPMLGGGVDSAVYGYPLARDLDGLPRSTTIFDIGPYYGSDLSLGD